MTPTSKSRNYKIHYDQDTNTVVHNVIQQTVVGLRTRSSRKWRQESTDIHRQRRFTVLIISVRYHSRGIGTLSEQIRWFFTMLNTSPVVNNLVLT